MAHNEGEALIDRVDVLVTDDQADPELIERFTATGVRVVIAAEADR